ncbi:hypothetical protein BGZ49_010200 [Haplosporangium sp. Z 27]|nr:hypothetical protein BGZ49_010200 [Haplosporangium sp. Z 27]
MLRRVFSPSSHKLSLEETLAIASHYLESARNESDHEKALKFAKDAKSELKDAERIFATERAGNPAIDIGIATAYHEHGELMDKLKLHDKALKSYDEATKWGYINVQSQQILLDDMSNDCPPASHLTAIASIPIQEKPPSEATLQLPSVFSQDVTPPFSKYSLPNVGRRLSSTPQLVYCLSLLQSPQELQEELSEAERKWIQTTVDDPYEKERLQAMASELIQAFVQQELKDRASVDEIVCLAPVLNDEDFRALLLLFVNGINSSTLLDVNQIDGLVNLIRNSGQRTFDASDLVEILNLLSARLKVTHDQSTRHFYKLTLALSAVLDSMAENKVEELSRDQIYVPLFECLESLQERSEPYLMYQAAYSFQALQYVPDDESQQQSIQRNAMNLIQGISGVTSGAKGMDFGSLLDGLKQIHQTVKGIAKPFIFNMKASSGVGENLTISLKDGFSFKRSWYPTLRSLDGMLKGGRLLEFKELVYQAPCRLEPPFQLGVCQRLGELAMNPDWEVISRENAVDFLGEIYKNDRKWGRNEGVKEWILHILRQLEKTPEQELATMAQTLVLDLETASKSKKQGTIQKEPISSYPLMITLPPKSFPLLDSIQCRVEVETDLVRLRRERLQDQVSELYISPQAKCGLNGKEIFDLTSNVQQFLESDKKVFLLLGDSGAGKSTFNRALETSLWKTSQNDSKEKIPLFIHLPSIADPEYDLISKHLLKADFTEDQIRELKLERDFILICDGYDESQQTSNLYRSNQLNQPGGWRAQMVISCRIEYIGADYMDWFQPIDRNNRGVSKQFQEAVVVPFSKDQIKGYIERYVSLNEPKGLLWGIKDYEKAFDHIPNLLDLVTNPFLLKLAMEVLPQLVDKNSDLSSKIITRIILYDEFVDQWIDRNKIRLMEIELSDSDKEQFKMLSNDGFKESCILYLKELVTGIYYNQGGNPVVTYSDLRDQKSWKEVLFSNVDGKNLLREAIPIIRNHDQFRFIHKSILEYGLSLAIFDPSEHQKAEEPATVPARRGSTSSIQSFESQDATEMTAINFGQPLEDSPFWKKSFVGEPSILQFLVERVQQHQIFKDQLLAVIERSKSDSTSRKAAANAITVLVRSGTQFNGEDLKGIQIPGADLSYGMFDSAQLQGADLRKVNLFNIWLHQANLEGARMSGVELSEYPFLEEDSPVNSCCYSPDGKVFTTVLENGNISMYSASTWEKFLSLKGDSKFDSRIVFSPKINTQFSCVYGSPTVQIRDYETSDYLRTLIGHTNSIKCMVYSPDGSLLVSGSDDKTMRIWDVETGECRHKLSDYGYRITGIVFSPKGDTIINCIEDTMQFWNVETGEKILSNSYITGFWYQGPIYSPKGDQFTIGDQYGTLEVKDIKTGDRVCYPGGDYIRCIVYSPKGDQIATGRPVNDSFNNSRETLVLWDSKTGESIIHLVGHTGSVNVIVYSPKGDLIASSSDDMTVRVWNVETGACIQTLSNFQYEIDCIAFSPKRDQIACSSIKDTKLRLWDVQIGTSRHSFDNHKKTILSVAYSPKGDHVASGGNDGMARVWNLETGTCRFALSGRNTMVRKTVVSKNGKSRETTECLYEPDFMQELVCSGGPVYCKDKRIYLEDHPVTCIVFSPTGNQIATGNEDDAVRLWDVETGECLNTLAGHIKPIWSVAYSPNGDRVVSGSADKTARLWDIETGQDIHTLQGHKDVVNSVSYSPKGDQIASASDDKTVRLWDIKTGKSKHTLKGHGDLVKSVSYSPKGDRVASGSHDKTLRLWDVATGACSHVFKEVNNSIIGIAYSPTGDVIASVSDDNKVGLWDAGILRQLDIQGLDGVVNNVAWGAAADGCFYLVTSSDNIFVRKWKIVRADNGFRAILLWSSGHDTLNVAGTIIDGAHGLGSLDKKLLSQKGSVGEASTV